MQVQSLEGELPLATVAIGALEMHKRIKLWVIPATYAAKRGQRSAKKGKISNQGRLGHARIIRVNAITVMSLGCCFGEQAGASWSKLEQAVCFMLTAAKVRNKWQVRLQHITRLSDGYRRCNEKR